MRTAPDLPARETYYEQVAAYYDFDAPNFEERAKQNAVLGRIREDFRAVSEPFVTGNVLEIGCGPGLDLLYWAQRKPQAHFYGLDISPAMLEHARRNVSAAGVSNVETAVGSVEEDPFPGVQFDFAFCYFGALNTTRDLTQAARAIRGVLRPEGVAVLTFVNQWYLFEIFWSFLTGKWRRAIARLRPVWGGYASGRSLESRCYSPGQIQRCFGPYFEIVGTRGYSILYPAWYRHERWVKRWPRLCNFLWQVDRFLSRTPCWRLGEYALYILKAHPPAPASDH